MRSGRAEPFYEQLTLKMLGIDKLKAIKTQPDDAAAANTTR